MGNTLYVFGCGGHARSIVNAYRSRNVDGDVILVDSNCEMDEVVLNCETITFEQFERQNLDEFNYIVGKGDNAERERIFEDLCNRGGYAVSVIARSAELAVKAEVGDGTYIAAGTYVGPEAKIGENAIINTGAVIEHGVLIGNGTHAAPNTVICGRSVIGNHVFIGAGSTVIDKIKIADGAIIGAGSVVIKDIREKGTYVGNPVRRIR